MGRGEQESQSPVRCEHSRNGLGPFTGPLGAPQVSLTSVTGESQEPIGKNSKNQIELEKIGGQVSRFC